jgi:phosphate transport system permease protein
MAKVGLWFFAGTTIVTLFTIVGYIIINGFYTRDVEFAEVLAAGEEAVPLGPDTDQELAVVVHRRLPIDDIVFDELRTLVQTPAIAAMEHTWGLVAGQEITVQPATLTSGQFRTALEEAFLTEETFWEEMEYFGSPEEVVEYVRNNRGGLGLVPASAVEGAPGVKVLSVRRISAVVHPDILGVQAARRLRELLPTELEQLFTGAVKMWSEVGGPRIEIRSADPAAGDMGLYEELPVVPVLFRTGNEYYDRLLRTGFGKDLTIAASARYVRSADEFVEAVSTTPGAIGLIYSPLANRHGLPTVTTRLVHHERNLRLSFLFTPPSHAGKTGGISTIIINTLIFIFMTLLFATPIGIAAAVYLVEYAKQGPLVRLLRIGTDTLAGIPSIIFGLFGLVVFSQFFGLKTGLMSGTLTVTLMILPTIVRTSEEALKTVPRDLREGSMALGATKLQTIFRVVIPAATPGILTGMILAVGRAVGETAAVLYTIGSNMQLLKSLNSPVRVITIHLYMLIREGISLPNAFASATILVVIVFLVNFSTRRLIAGRKVLAGK